MKHTPQEVLQVLFPTLLSAARYANLIQHRIEAVADKEDATNIFAAALSDADLSIQTAVEMAILSQFPEIPFFGEEWKSSRNTKYFKGNSFLSSSPYLITLDPIDGTRIYLDGKKRYQIILTVVSRDGFEAALVLYPALGEFVYALKGKGAYRGSFGIAFENAGKITLTTGSSRLFLSAEFKEAIPKLSKNFSEIFCSANYKKDQEFHHVSSCLLGELDAAVISNAQIIDSAALAFMAKEMGFIVQTIAGDPIPRPEDFPELIFPNLIIAPDLNTLSLIKAALDE